MRSTCSLALLAVLAAGCDCSDPTGEPCTSDEECEANEVCRDGLCAPRPDGGPRPDAGPGMDGGRMDAGGPECTDDEGCPGDQVCVGGGCCAPDAVCGDACCGDGQTCFANACVTPGRVCRSAEDCDEGQYCEPSLGEGGGVGDGGVPMPDAGMGRVCLGAAPTPGRCVDLPPRCEGDPMPGEVCIRDCEYRPPVDRLDAVPQWRWGEGTATEFTGRIDVWATPTVGRLTDTNCDGVVDEFDPPNVVFVSGNSRGTCCSCGGYDDSCKTGVLRVLDGQTGAEVWSLRRPADGSLGFAGLSVALGDVDHDGDMEIATVNGEGYVVLVDHTGAVVATSDQPIPDFRATRAAGWGGGLSIADMDRDGSPEIAYGRVVFTTDGATVTRRWIGAGTWGRGLNQAVSVFVDLDDDPELELLAGRTVYEPTGDVKWNRTDLPTGFSAAADFDDDPAPEVVHVADGVVYLLSAADGSDEVSSVAAPAVAGTDPGNGGPPTIADFDGDGAPEIGVAWRNNYQVVEVNGDGTALQQLWATPNHDFSSSVTGSTVFDFEGDGAAEVIYNDECFLWVYDGQTGAVRFATPTTSFTATEASLVADVDSDGSAEIVMVANSASPSSWHCDETYNGTDWTMPAPPGAPDEGRPGWVGSDGVGAGGAAYRGLVVWRAADNSWVGTRSLWNQHAYSVSNICGDRGDACTPPSTYGDIPIEQVPNWTVGFLNNFRQNIQGEGIFDAPDATVTLEVLCTTPVTLRASVRNLGAAVLTDGVEVAVVLDEGGTERELGRATTTTPLFPGQVEVLEIEAPADVTAEGNVFRARIEVDPTMPTFRECREDNNQSDDVEPRCLM
ncbi:MAG TPA: VCBS repeat-containing protein [Sandaracinaceae bacterium LLY-WYZ-13_1]|nr:VCBS repeat-containing protein [Sandaracinaceae bacterium LLY-WYZ-13_1]